MKMILKIAAGILGLAGLGCIGLFLFEGGGAGKLVWEDPVVRKSIMTFGYKVYGDTTAENGRFFLSKIVFRNDGAGPVRDLSISYQIPDYVPWTTPGDANGTAHRANSRFALLSTAPFQGNGTEQSHQCDAGNKDSLG